MLVRDAFREEPPLRLHSVYIYQGLSQDKTTQDCQRTGSRSAQASLTCSEGFEMVMKREWMSGYVCLKSQRLQKMTRMVDSNGLDAGLLSSSLSIYVSIMIIQLQGINPSFIRQNNRFLCCFKAHNSSLNEPKTWKLSIAVSCWPLSRLLRSNTLSAQPPRTKRLFGFHQTCKNQQEAVNHLAVKRTTAVIFPWVMGFHAAISYCRWWGSPIQVARMLNMSCQRCNRNWVGFTNCVIWKKCLSKCFKGDSAQHTHVSNRECQQSGTQNTLLRGWICRKRVTHCTKHQWRDQAQQEIT